MTLEFRPPYQINPNQPGHEERSLATLGQTFSDLGDTAMKFSQQQKQNQRQDMLMKWAKDAHDFDYGNGDSNATGGAGAAQSMGPYPSGSLQQGTTGPQPMSMPGHDQPMSYADNIPTSYSPSYPQAADAGTPDTGWPQQPAQGPQPGQPMHQPGADLSGHFNAWKQQGGGAYNHPEMGGAGQASSPNPMDRYSQIMSMPGAKRRMEASSIFKNVGEGYKAMYPDTTEPVISQDDALRAGTVKKGARIIDTSTSGSDSRAAALTDKQLSDAQKAVNSDKNIEKSQSVVDKISEAVPLLKAGVIDNATAKQALQTVMTYAATGGMRVNEVELRQFGGANAVTNKMAQWYQGLDKGTLTARDAKDMTAVLDIFGKSAQKNLQEAGLRHTRQYIQRSRSGESEPDAYKRVTGRDFTATGGQDQTVQRVGKDGQTYTYTLNPRTGQYE